MYRLTFVSIIITAYSDNINNCFFYIHAKNISNNIIYKFDLNNFYIILLTKYKKKNVTIEIIAVFCCY